MRTHRWKSTSKRSKKQRRHAKRQRFFERLEARVVLNGMPIANADPWYSTAEDTALTVGTSDTTLVDNDWDPEGDTLTASIVDNPSDGSVTNFSSTNGTFTYTPDTSFTGVDTFTYKVNDGTDDSSVVTVSIAVGNHLGPRTNQDERARDSQLLTGEVQLAEPLTPGLSLIYDSSTLPQPIVILETFLQSGSSVPDEIDAQLTFNSTAGTTYSYDTTGLSAGDSLRFALQADATSLASGRYDYTVKLTTDMSGTYVDHTYAGASDVVNRGDSTHPFGRGWQLAGLDELVIDTGGVLLVKSNGDALWFEEDGSGGYEAAEGDLTFSTLVKNGDNTYTLTDKHGIEAHFSSTGSLTSREDRNGNTLTYTYTSGLLTKITDEVNRDTTFTYTSGQLTSVSDFASRTATLAYDTSGRLTKITQPDPDGAGSLAAPETEFAYDTTSHQLTKVTNPLDDETDYEYGSHDRLTKITHDDNNTWQLTALQTVGLPTATTGNNLTSADPTGTVTNERAKSSAFRTDRFGNVIEWNNELSHQTLSERNVDGLLVKLTEADPDGSQTKYASPVTVYGYDDNGNLVFQQNADDSTKTWTYTSTFNQVATATDELNRTISYAYDIDGNRTSVTDAAGYVTTYAYNTDGLVTSLTLPDPDGTGPLAAAVTSYAYDTYNRLTTQTNPDSTTRTFAYDSADNRTSETDERGNAATFEYDNLNRLTSSTDRGDAETTFAYDAIGQLIETVDPLNNETDYEYNSRGWKTKVIHPDPDGAGPLTRPESTTSYDAGGNVTATGDYFSASMDYVYDDAGRRTSAKRNQTETTTYEYDNLGRVKRTLDAESQETLFEYNDRGQTTKVILGDGWGYGPATEYAFDAAGQKISVTDARGYTTTFTYNSRGLLVSETLPDPDGSGPQFSPRTTYQYDNAGRLTGELGLYCRVTEHEYDNRNRLTKTTLPDPDDEGSLAAPVLTYTYDNVGNRLTETDALGNVTTYAYDKEGRVTSVTGADPDGTGPLTAPVTSFVFDDNGQTTSTTDPLGNVTSFEYNVFGQRTKITQPDPDGTGPLAAPVTTYEYAGSDVTKITDPLGRETTFAYDLSGRRTSSTDDSGNATTYTYDSIDRVIKVTQPDPDGTGPLVAPATNYSYDRHGNIASVRDPASKLTLFTYDDVGNLLTVKDPTNNTTTFAYDGVGRMTIETNQLSKSRSFEYDAAGNLQRRKDRNGRVIQYTHDGLERVTDEKWYSGASNTPTLSFATTTEGGTTDEVQRVGFSEMELLSGTFTLTFDGATTATIAYDATAAQVQSALEALSSIDAGEVAVTKIQDEMDVQEWKLTFQDGLGGTNVAQTTIDASNVVGWWGPVDEIEATDVTGGSVNDEVQTATLSNANGGTFRLAFSGETTGPLDHDATASEVETKLEELNAIDNVTVTGSAGGPWTITFIGTLASTNVPQLMGDATSLTNGTLEHSIEFVYDANNQITSASDDDSSYDYTYDNLGRLLSVDNDGTSGVPNVILSYAYDAGNNRTSLSAEIDSTDDFLNSYTYDNLGRLTQLDQEGQTGGNSVAEKRVDFSYNVGGQYTEIARYNDTDGNSGDEVATSNFTYDTLGRLTDLDYENGGVDLFTPYEWTYDSLSSTKYGINAAGQDARGAALARGPLASGLGRVTQFVSADGTTDYTYDATSQLTDADHDYQTDETYTYDASGNRTMTGYTTGSNNRLTSDGTYDYEYDDEGNRTKRTDTSTYDETTYDWDFRNRLVKVTEGGYMGTSQVVEYTYDVFDRRIAKAVDTTSPFNMADAVIERYVYDDANGVSSVDGGNVVLDFVDPDGTGSTAIDLERRQLFGQAVDQILAQEDVDETITSADRVLWHLADNLGTVRDLAKNDGTLGEHYKYDSYGNVTSGDTSVTRYLFTSREFDEDVDLQYNRARYYDAAVGRWVSEDPMGLEAGDGNVARYVGNTPTVSIDASGLQETRSPSDPEDRGIDGEGVWSVDDFIERWVKAEPKMEKYVEIPRKHGCIGLSACRLGPQFKSEDKKAIASVAEIEGKVYDDETVAMEMARARSELEKPIIYKVTAIQFNMKPIYSGREKRIANLEIILRSKDFNVATRMESYWEYMTGNQVTDPNAKVIHSKELPDYLHTFYKVTKSEDRSDD